MSQNRNHNGCGPSWLPQWVKRLLFNWFFEASCNKHDEGYIQGGDEVRRFECDWKFKQAMNRDISNLKGLKKLYARIVSNLYYIIVRLFGQQEFNYHD